MSLRFLKNKKIIFGSIGLLSLTSLSAISVVSCSGNRTPNVQQNVEYIFDGNVIHYNSSGYLECSTGSIQGFTSTPKLDPNNPITYDARNKFYSIEIFSGWTFPFFSSFQKLLSVYTLENLNNPNNNMTTNQKQIGLSLATNLLQGNETIRYGLQSVRFTQPNWPIFSSFLNSPSAKPIEVTFSGIELTFNWWSTTDGSNVVWRNDNFNPNNELTNSPNWAKWTELGYQPASKATLSFNKPLTMKLNPQMVDNKCNGIFDIDSNISQIAIGNSADDASKQETNKYVDLLNQAYKVSNGDINNVVFSDFYKNNKAEIDNILSWFLTK